MSNMFFEGVSPFCVYTFWKYIGLTILCHILSVSLEELAFYYACCEDTFRCHDHEAF